MSKLPATVYEQLGGDESVHRIVEAFYDIVEADPIGKPVHDLHLAGFGIAHLRQAQFEFLCGFFGGPRYYVERFGHSNVRKMHEHVAIGRTEADAWLACMTKALEVAEAPPEVAARIMRTFETTANVLINRP